MVGKDNGTNSNQSGNNFTTGFAIQDQAQTQNSFMIGNGGENQVQSKSIFGSQINYQSGSFSKPRK